MLSGFRTSLTFKLSVAFLTVCGITAAGFLSIGWSSFRSIQQEAIGTLDHNLNEGFDRTLRAEVEAIHSLVGRYHQWHLQGQLTLEQAKEQAAEAIREIRGELEALKGNADE